MKLSYRDEIEQAIRQQAVPSHKFGHQPRMYALCQVIGASLSYDDDVVFAGVWLHDLGVFQGNRPESLEELLRWDHVAFARDHGCRMLAATDFPKEKIAQEGQVIDEHQAHNAPTSIESEMVRDADILEQLGAIGILRSAAKLGSDTRFTYFTDVKNYLRGQLVSLAASLHLPVAKELAKPKLNALGDFLEALDRESVPACY